MKIPMPMDAAQIAQLTGNNKYAKQYSERTMPWKREGYRLMAWVTEFLYNIDLSDTKLEETSAEKIKALVKKLVPDIPVKEVNFYPLKSKLEIIYHESYQREA